MLSEVEMLTTDSRENLSVMGEDLQYDLLTNRRHFQLVEPKTYVAEVTETCG